MQVDTIKPLANENEAAVQTDSSTTEISSQPISTPPTTKQVYNDTLKANVVIDLVTLAPVKSNSGKFFFQYRAVNPQSHEKKTQNNKSRFAGVGRPIRPRPKLDKEKQKQTTEATSTTTATINSTDESILLERLFGLQSGEAEPQQQREFSKDTPFGGTVEQIIEVVTSISTKVSSSVKGDSTIIKLGEIAIIFGYLCYVKIGCNCIIMTRLKKF